MKRWLVEFFATGAYLGRLPKTPGTWGTLGAIPLAGWLRNLGQFGYMVAILVILIGAIGVAHIYDRRAEGHDASEIVIDEIIGYLVAVMWLPWTWQTIMSAFVLFRILDIFKPFPIGYLDRNLPGGLGVVMDDAFAGMVTNIILQIIYWQTHWLGQQWTP